MDRDFGSKPGSGGVASAQQQNVDRRERLRQLALQTLDISKDPYLLRNHLGSYECKLCLTLHNNEVGPGRAVGVPELLHRAGVDRQQSSPTVACSRARVLTRVPTLAARAASVVGPRARSLPRATTSRTRRASGTRRTCRGASRARRATRPFCRSRAPKRCDRRRATSQRDWLRGE